MKKFVSLPLPVMLLTALQLLSDMRTVGIGQ